VEPVVFDALTIPPPVGPGGHIRVVSPGIATLNFVPARYQRAERVLTDLGFTVSYGSRAFLVAADGLVSGSGEDRAADLMAAFTDPSVDVIMAADSGLGSRDLLEHLDPAVIAANPKTFVGYCDNVFINHYLATEAGLSSLVGCTLMVHIGEAGGAFPETLDHLQRALGGAAFSCEPLGPRVGTLANWYEPVAEATPRPRDMEGGWDWLRPGAARGPFVAAEVTLVPELVEGFGLDLRGTVLSWDVGAHGLPEEPLVDELFRLPGIRDLAGMVVGSHAATERNEWAKTVSGFLDDFLPGIDYPVVVNADVSHTSPSWTVPYGEEVVLESPDRVVFTRRTAGAAGRGRP
jgi:muramoyltetrapeptide carboxypeptidase